MKDEQLYNQKDALIDKVILGNFTILKIENIEKLELDGYVSIEKNAKNYAYDRAETKYNNVHIKGTNCFDDFYYGRNKLTGNYYGKLEISVQRKENHNLHCWKLSELIKQVEKIQKYLEDMGIIVDFRYLKIKKIEINKTITLENDCIEYHRVIKQIIKLLPTYLQRTQSIYLDDDENYTYYSAAKSTEVKIYNKSGQLEKTFNILVENNYLRFEITLSGFDAIQRNLTTNILSEITQNQLNHYFNDFINENVIKTHNEWIDETQKQLIKLIKQKQKIRNTWDEIIEYILNFEIENEIPMILDYENLISTLDFIKFKNKQQKYKAKKRIQEIVFKNAPILKNNDTEKYIEITQKLVSQRSPQKGDRSKVQPIQ